MVQVKKETFNRLQVIAVIWLLIGLIFASMNFISPHTVLRRASYQISTPHIQSVASINDSYINGNHYYPQFNPPNKDYLSLPPVYVNVGETITATWITDSVIVSGYIFSQSQFTNFQTALQSMENNTNLFLNWASKNGTNYEASGSGKQDAWVSYNVTESGYYVAIIFVEQVFTRVQTFEEYLVTYTFQRQWTALTVNDNLYLFIGIAFISSGTPTFIYSLMKVRRHRKTANQNQ